MGQPFRGGCFARVQRGYESRCNWEHGKTSRHGKTSGHKSITGERLNGLLQYVHSWAWECSYKLNDQPVHERIAASSILIHKIIPLLARSPSFPSLVLRRKAFDATNLVSHFVYTFECESMRIIFASVDRP